MELGEALFCLTTGSTNVWYQSETKWERGGCPAWRLHSHIPTAAQRDPLSASGPKQEPNSCGSLWSTPTPGHITQFGIAQPFFHLNFLIYWPAAMLGLGKFCSISFSPCKCLVHSEGWLLLFWEIIFLQKHIWQQRQDRGEKKAPTEGCSLPLERVAPLERNMKAVSCCKAAQMLGKGTAWEGEQSQW